MRYTLAVCLSLGWAVSSGQPELSSFAGMGSGIPTVSLSDYQTLGINPANLGWSKSGKMINLGLAEVGFMIYSEPLKKALVNELFNKDKVFSEYEKEEAIMNFTDSRLLINLGAMYGGLSFYDPKIGGFGFNVRERFSWSSNLNSKSAEFLFKGYNSDFFDTLIQQGDTIGVAKELEMVSKVFRGTRIQLQWFREFNFGYGRQLVNNDQLTWYAGVGLKYLTGYAIFEYGYEDDGLVAYSAITPSFDINYSVSSPSLIEGNDFQNVGHGFGFDVGSTLVIKNKIKVGLAVCDIGSITWDGNVYKGQDGLLETIETSGLENYANIYEEVSNISLENTDWGNWEGLNELTVNLPTNLRAGASYLIGQKAEVGGDMYLPLNEEPGNFEKIVAGVGGRFKPIPWFELSAGVISGGYFGVAVPLGFSFTPINRESLSWELGFAFRDAVSLVKQENPNVSFGFGLMRFSFGKAGISAQPSTE